MYAGYKEEGDTCGADGCRGVLGFGEVEGCSCHISPPCHQCVENPLRCPECGWTDVNEPAERHVSVAPGLTMVEPKPRQLDNSKIDYRSKMHSPSSMLREGVYPAGTTQQEVESVVRGTFEGRFDSFGNGRFRYVAYTD